MWMPVEVYSRVVGYFSPVKGWNKGKKEEFSCRKNFKIRGSKMEEEIKKAEQAVNTARS